MKRFMRLFLLFILGFGLSFNFSYANEEVVILKPSQVHKLDTPQTIDEILDSVNLIEEVSVNSDFELEDDIASNKIEKSFYKFVNDRVVNKQMNLFSSAIGRAIDE